jgi:pimeloyl-ACP methyl ester carboxylesterase
MNKRMIKVVVGLLVVAGLIFAAWKIRIDHYPLQVEPSTTWEPFINSLDAEQKSYFVNSGGTMLEADLFIPNGGSEKKPAVVFTPGSGDSDYHNYAGGLVETYVLDVFLSHDVAVLLVNKRGMGQSEGNYVKNSIQGRADDVYAAVQSIQTHPQIDADNIGLIGHSQGGWVVTQVAADHPEIAFFISLVGPTMTMQENAADNFYHFGRCQGLEGEELETFIEQRLKKIDMSISIGKIIDFGFPGFDARNMSYDPQNALKTVQSSGLFVYAENDNQVTPAPNLERMNEIFENDIPENLSVIVIDDANHAFQLVNDPCVGRENPELQQSGQLVEVLHAWLAEQGY